MNIFNVLNQEEEKELSECLTELDSAKEIPSKEAKIEELKEDYGEKITKLELKLLPDHLKYVFLDDECKKPVIIIKLLANHEEKKLVQVLKENQGAISWVISDLKGISPSHYMHNIMMEENYKPIAQPQWSLNPLMKEVIRKEVVKLLEAGIIYPILDSAWVSPVQVEPKKGGMTVVTKQNELIPTRTVTECRMCIDYRRLNQATRKDHFPLPFMHQILERLSG